MKNTKENILMTALELFARDGYEAVSVSMIAGELGMTKGALYKHYKNKRDIFDSIVNRMYQLDSERSKSRDVPEDTYENAPEQYKHTKTEDIRRFTIEQYKFWTEDKFASCFRKMLTLEQYRSAEMNELYQKCIVSGPVDYMEDLFRELINEGVLRENDPKQLALEFYAPFYLLISMYDGMNNNADGAAMLAEHIERFIENNKEI